MRNAACLLFCAAVAVAQPVPMQWQAETQRRVEAAVEGERVRQGVVGLTAGVAIGGVTKWIGAFGKADLENDVPARPQTLYRTGSIAKPLTAIAALQLWERGKLDLDAPVQRYVPSFPEKAWPITVRMLLGHLAGIRHYREGEIDSTRHYLNLLDPLGIFSADPLAHRPRSRYLYSTYGYNLAGAAVEAAAGIPFLDFLRENVLRPAGMASTREDNTYDIVAHRTRWYSRAPDGRIVNAHLADTSNKVPGGGMLTTAGDLLQLAASWQGDRLLKPATRRMQAERQTLLDGKRTEYGLGWSISEGAIGHSGSQQGCKTILTMRLDTGIAIVVVTNSDHAVPARLAEVIRKAL